MPKYYRILGPNYDQYYETTIQQTQGHEQGFKYQLQY